MNNPYDHEESVFDEIVEAFNGPTVEDVVPRKVNPEAVAAMYANHGKPATVSFMKMTPDGLETEYVEGLFLVGGMPYRDVCDD